MTAWRIAAVNFDQMHMNQNAEWVDAHPDAELVALCDENPSQSTGSMERAATACGITDERMYADLEACLDATNPDIVVMGPANADHAAYTERVAPYHVHVIVEKPFADTLANADNMIETMEKAGKELAVNWPSTWSPTTRTLKRLISNGTIGNVVEAEAYIGHAGPPRQSWFYEADMGGGSLLDFLGYAAVNTTWFREGELPTTVTAETYSSPDTNVDTRSVSLCTYESGRFSTFQTTWERHEELQGHAPEPNGGDVIVGTEGTLSTRGVDGIRVQNPSHPTGTVIEPDVVEPPYENVIQYVLHCLETGESITGPTAPMLSRNAQQILETARLSAERGERIELKN